MIEEIRKRIKARMDNTYAVGDYDEYADGQGVGLAAALRIIDDIEKEHPIPEDVQEAAKAYSASVSNGHHFRDLETGFAAGMLAERERLMKEAVEGQVTEIDTARFLDIDQDICDKRLAECKDGDKVKLIILK